MIGQLEPSDPIFETRIVVDIVGDGGHTAYDRPLQDDGLETFTGSIYRRRQAAGAGANYYHVICLVAALCHTYILHGSSTAHYPDNLANLDMEYPAHEIGRGGCNDKN